MSASAEYQKFIVTKLRNSAAVGNICGDRIYDNVPKEPKFPYVSIGPSDYFHEDAECINSRVETVQVDIWSRDHGAKLECKQLTDAVRAALHNATGDLGQHALVSALVSLVRVLDDTDGITKHGVVQVTAHIEEN